MMKHNLRSLLSLLLALALALSASAAFFSAFAAEPGAAPSAVSGIRTDGGKNTDAADVSADGDKTGAGVKSPVEWKTDGGDPDATATDASPTDASPTDATPTDVPSAAARVSGGYTYVVSNGQAVILAADETVKGDVTVPALLGGAPVGVIGMGAFKGNDAVTSVSLPDTVSVVDEQAFAGCVGLEKLVCGAALAALPESAYADCGLLNNRIEIPAAAAGFTVESDGQVVYNRDKTELLFVDPGVSGTFTVPESVTYVRSGAFRGCASVTEIVFRNPAAVIGARAFEGCAALKKITLPAKLTEIREGTFAGCAALDDVTLPATVAAVGDAAFEGCAALSHLAIPEGCLSLGGHLFENCVSLESVTVYAPLTAVPEAMFAGCAALKEAVLLETVTEVGDMAFRGCEALENVPDVFGLKRFGRAAFIGTAWYEKQVDGLYIVNDTLLFCKGVADKDVDLSDKKITVIAPGAFENQSSLETVKLPDGLTEIGAFAFAGCAKLSSVGFTGAARIGESAFADTAFAAAAGGKELYLGGNLIQAEKATATDASPTDASQTVYTVKPGTRTIAGGAFLGRPRLTEIVLPEGLEILSDGAFAGLDALGDVDIPSTVRYGDKAFEGRTAPCAHEKTVRKYADTAVCVRPHFSGCVYCAECAALLEVGSLLAPAGHRYQKTGQEPDPVLGEVAVTLRCAVCGDIRRVPMSEYMTSFTDGEKARAEGDYIIIAPDAAMADLLAGSPEGTIVLTAQGDAAPETSVPGSGMTVLFPAGRTYTVVRFGDADGDGAITSADARIALRRSVGLEEAAGWRDRACHVVWDGKQAVTPEDARRILRASVKLENPALFGIAPAPATPTDATPTDATPTDATPTDATSTDATPTDAPPTDQHPTKPPKEEEKPPVQPEKTYLPGEYVCRAEGGVYLRAYHGYDYSSMDIIRNGDTVTVRDVYRDADGKEPVWWGRITYHGVTGWAVLAYFEAK